MCYKYHIFSLLTLWDELWLCRHLLSDAFSQILPLHLGVPGSVFGHLSNIDDFTDKELTGEYQRSLKSYGVLKCSVLHPLQIKYCPPFEEIIQKCPPSFATKTFN